MSSHQIQVQPGMSTPEFLSRFGTEAQCTEAIRCVRWPNGFRCPRCASQQHYASGHGARKLCPCGACRHQASLTAGSLFVNLVVDVARTRPTQKEAISGGRAEAFF